MLATGNAAAGFSNTPSAVFSTVNRFLKRVSKAPYSPYLLVVVPLLIATIREVEELFLFGSGATRPDFSEAQFRYTINYMFMLLLLILALRIATGKPWRNLTMAACLGLLFAILPPLLDSVSLQVEPGERVCLVGRNGIGKSTLMMTVFGRPRARSGRILFDGRDITEVPTHEIARLRIAQSPEGRRIFPRKRLWRFK